jgi:hypothetical protein
MLHRRVLDFITINVFIAAVTVVSSCSAKTCGKGTITKMILGQNGVFYEVCVPCYNTKRDKLNLKEIGVSASKDLKLSTDIGLPL